MNKEMLNYTQNRELSWLRFNDRLLEEAQDLSVPLLERMKFVAIFTSNLDEFFMIRVGSLFDMYQSGVKKADSRSGMNPKEQLDAIFDAVAPVYKKRDKIYEQITNELNHYGICGLAMKDLEAQEKKYVKKYFKEQILPVLSPQVVDANHPFPHLHSDELYIIANLQKDNKTKLGIVPVPKYVADVIYLPGHDIRYVCTERVIAEFLEQVFDMYEVSEKNCICVTRNADISPDDEVLDIHEDFRHLMKKTLHKRRKMAAVRLEISESLTKDMEKVLCDKLHLTTKQIYRSKAPIKLGFVFGLIDKIPESMKKILLDEPFVPQASRYIAEGPVMNQIKKRDVLMSYPYESMDPFLKMIKEAAYDPNVMTIRITIYRLAKKARLVEYLCAAAENGKEVTVLIELRARFDEQNNIDWSERLEEAGCRIVYGFEGIKVHSKICLITYRNKNEVQYITQIGTGNYNEKTAKLYTDVSLLTADERIGRDAAEFFKNMFIGNLNGNYEHLLVAPTSLKQKILMLMDEEIQKGAEGRIVMKMNSVTDTEFIRKLSEASKAGVRIDMIVRGICCVRPGVEGYTDNLNVISIVGRFLEHARIFSFGTGLEQKIYIGSADMMTRNTEKRVEVACPVYDKELKKQLNHILEVMLEDNQKARVLQSDGSYKKKENGTRIVCAQEYFMKEAISVKKPERQVEKKTFLAWIRDFLHRRGNN